MCRIQAINYSPEELMSHREILKFNKNFKLENDLEVVLKELSIFKNLDRSKRGKSVKSNILNLVNWNIEGLKNVNNSSPDVETKLFENADILLLTETFCTEAPIPLQGYYATYSPAIQGELGRPIGGIALYSKPYLEIEPVCISENKVQAKSIFGTIIGYYFNPSHSLADIIAEITEDLLQSSETCIIGGDFNCRIDRDDPRGKLLTEFMTSQSFRLLTDSSQPTYRTHNGSSCIDLLFVRTNKQKVLKSYKVVLDPIRKHQRVVTSIRLKQVNKPKEQNKVKLSRKIDLVKIQNHPLLSTLMPELTNDILNFNNILIQAAINDKKRNKPHKPWFDLECKIMKSRNILLLKNIHNSTPEEKLKCRQEYKVLIKKKKMEYEEQIILNKCKIAETKPWEMFSKQKNNVTPINLKTLITHFQTLYNLDGTLDLDPNTEESLNNNATEWYNRNISLEEISKAVKHLKNNKAAGPDSIYNEHLKLTFDFFQDWWVIYLNQLFTCSTVPNIWRLSNLKVIFKGKGNITDPNNYRGVALLNTSYKLYTKILNNRIMNQMESKLPEEQYGFRCNRNCQKAIQILRTDIKDALSKPKGIMYAIFIDYQKAFDSIDRTILINTLNKIGIKGKTLKAVSNIVTSNSLFIDNGVERSKFPIEQRKGVTQGDPLSATLFILYINNLPAIFNDLDVKCLLFADDLVIYSENKDELQIALNNLHSWCIEYKLKINNSKSQVLKFRKGGKLKSTDLFLYNNYQLSFVNEYKYLGIILQPTLTITKHIENVTVKASHAAAMIQNLQKISLNCADKIFHMKIWPIITYCFNVLAADLTEKHLHQLDKTKAFFYKKLLCLHKCTSNTLVFHMANVKRLGEEIIEKYQSTMDVIEIKKYKDTIEEKNLLFCTEKYTDGPAFTGDNWKNYCQENRHLITRYTAHGFHNKICSKKEYHLDYNDCICTLCNHPIVHRYHLENHIREESETLTSFLTKLVTT